MLYIFLFVASALAFPLSVQVYKQGRRNVVVEAGHELIELPALRAFASTLRKMGDIGVGTAFLAVSVVVLWIGLKVVLVTYDFVNWLM
jgi:hypothetical protein